jgi:hypothetical protein
MRGRDEHLLQRGVRGLLIAPKLGTIEVRLEGVEEWESNAVTGFATFCNMAEHLANTLPFGLHSEDFTVGG